MKAYSIILTSILNLIFLSSTIANENTNNVLESSDYNSLKSISDRSIVNSDISQSDIAQLANRSKFQVEKSSEYIRADLSVDGMSALIITEKSKSNPNFLTITIRAANANYNIELDPKNTKYIISGYGSKLGVEGKILLFAMITKMTEKKWSESENPYKSMSYRIVNWIAGMPAGMVTHTIDSTDKPKKGEPDSNNRSIILPRAQNNSSTESHKIRGMLGDCSDPLLPCNPPPVPECINIGDEDGILYMTCTYQLKQSSHDACDLHNFQSFTSHLGCNIEKNCPGRCGEKCGSDNSGKGTYSQDCADHDYCCSQHGGCTWATGSICSDEYWEADDDYLWGNQNCNGCSAVPPPPPPPCCLAISSTQTIVWGGGADSKFIELDYDLRRFEKRDDRSIFLDEWAIINSNKAGFQVASSSSQEFSNFVKSNQENFRGIKVKSGKILIIETAEGVHNQNEIPHYKIPEIKIDLGDNIDYGKHNFWFRAEVNQSGKIDIFQIIDDGQFESNNKINSIIKSEIEKYTHKNNEHRMILYTSVSLKDYTMEISEPMISTPQCCAANSEASSSSELLPNCP
ncbi:hypothetical protein ACJJIP_06400 [Microbulbifer sp. VTAC004]|uniref:hypothetical protein n=1 Tax=unclassified Microbulbifer TaxID=2619833 RepID=UPI00403A5BD6